MYTVDTTIHKLYVVFFIIFKCVFQKKIKQLVYWLNSISNTACFDMSGLYVLGQAMYCHFSIALGIL